jgi:hypothetical protein
MEQEKPQKIRLLSVDAIKAIYEQEIAKKRITAKVADCDEAKLQKIVAHMESLIPPDVEIDYISGEEIRAGEEIPPLEQQALAKKIGEVWLILEDLLKIVRNSQKEPKLHFRQLERTLEIAYTALTGALEELEHLEVERLISANQSER